MQYCAKIGKDVITSLLYTFGNESITYSPSLPEKCKQCPLREELERYSSFPDSDEYKDALLRCSSCECSEKFRIYRVKKNAVSNYPGKNTTLRRKLSGCEYRQASAAELLVFIAVHLLEPDRYGIVHAVSVEKLHNVTGKTPATIRRVLKLLEERGYIVKGHADERGYYSILIRNYGNYFLRASQGGRGYIHIDNKLFSELCSFKNVTLLRIALLQLCDSDISDKPIQKVFTRNYSQLQHYLPAHCKRGFIQSVLDKGKELFHIRYTKKEVFMELREDFDARRTYKELRSTFEKGLKDFVSHSRELIEHLIESDRGAIQDTYYLDVVDELKSNYKVYPEVKDISLTSSETSDLVTLSFEYGADIVKEAFLKALFSIASLPPGAKGKSNKNRCGYIRTVCESILLHNEVVLN